MAFELILRKNKRTINAKIREYLNFGCVTYVSDVRRKCWTSKLYFGGSKQILTVSESTSVKVSPKKESESALESTNQLSKIPEIANESKRRELNGTIGKFRNQCTIFGNTNYEVDT